MSQDIVSDAQQLVNQPATVENARQLGELIQRAKGEEKEFIYDLVESFLMNVDDPGTRQSLLEEIG